MLYQLRECNRIRIDKLAGIYAELQFIELGFDFFQSIGKFVNANTITFSQLIKQIYDEKLAMNEIQPQTYYRTMETVKLCKEINDIPVQKIDSTAIKQLLLSKVDYANSTIKKMYIILNQCFKEALKRKIISDNPMLDVRKPKSTKKTKKIRALTLNEQKA